MQLDHEKMRLQILFSPLKYFLYIFVSHDFHFDHEHILKHVHLAHEQVLFFVLAQSHQGPNTNSPKLLDIVPFKYPFVRVF